jgi:Predicted acyltransferases
MLIQFYLIFPLLFWTRGALDRGGFCSLDALRDFSHATSCSCSGRKTDCGYSAVSQVCRLPEFALGISLAMWYTQSPTRMEWFLLRGAGFVAGLILYPAALQLYHGLYDYIFVDFATGACCMLEIVGIAGLISLFNSPAKLFGLVGLYSYGLYLTHQPYVIWLGFVFGKSDLGVFIDLHPHPRCPQCMGHASGKGTNALVTSSRR